MSKNTPVFKMHTRTKRNDVGIFIRSYRLKNGITQGQLSRNIGFYSLKNRNCIVYDYECGRRLPGIKSIYRMSKELSIDRDSFFNLVLKEHASRFKFKHYQSYLKAVLDDTVVECRYYFHTGGRVRYNLSKFSEILKGRMKDKKITCLKLSEELDGGKYSRPYIQGIINGKKTASIRVVRDLANYFGIDSFKLYKIMVEEKVFAHAKNMFLEWEKYKEEQDEEKN